MAERLIKRIQLWSVLRTVFPITWIVSAVLFFLSCVFWGSLIMRTLEALGEPATSFYSSGLQFALPFSVAFGFLITILITFAAALWVVIYNLLTRLGGGIAIELDEMESPE